jgi:ribosome maturation protein SDO1
VVSVDESVIARFEKTGKVFEILVDPNLALKLRHKEQVNFDDLMAIDKVFSDARKGEEAKSADLTKIFGSTDVKKIAEKIIQEGHVQLTTEQRHEFAKRKRAEIIEYIARNAFNPQTKTPIPAQRIELAFDELKIHIDPMRSAKEQQPEIIEKLRALMPLSMASLKIRVLVPAMHSGKASNIIHQFKVLKEEWKSNGSLEAVIEMPAGMKEVFFSKINAVTHGSIEAELIEEK